MSSRVLLYNPLNMNSRYKLHYLNFLFDTANITKVKDYLLTIENDLLYEKEPHYLLILLSNITKENKSLSKFRKIMENLDLATHKTLAFLGPVVLAVADYHKNKIKEALFELTSEQQLLSKVLLFSLGYTPDKELGVEDPALFFSKLSS